MTDRTSLTAAEIAFLLSSRGADASTPVAAALRLTEADFTEPVRVAGLGSLVLRQLATPGQDQQVQLVSPVAAIAEGLATGRLLVQISLVAVGGGDASVLVDSSRVRFVVSPRAYRCFEITNMDASADPRQPLIQVADAFLGRFRPAVATFTATYTEAASPDDGPGSVSLAIGEDGLWRFIEGPDADNAVTVVDRAAARRMLLDGLGHLVRAPAQRSSQVHPPVDEASYST